MTWEQAFEHLAREYEYRLAQLRMQEHRMGDGWESNSFTGETWREAFDRGMREAERHASSLRSAVTVAPGQPADLPDQDRKA